MVMAADEPGAIMSEAGVIENAPIVRDADPAAATAAAGAFASRVPFTLGSTAAGTTSAGAA